MGKLKIILVVDDCVAKPSPFFTQLHHVVPINKQVILIYFINNFTFSLGCFDIHTFVDVLFYLWVSTIGDHRRIVSILRFGTTTMNALKDPL